MQATLEEAALAGIFYQGQCHAIGSGCFLSTAGTAEQIRLRRRQQVIAGEPRITAELLQQVQACGGPVAKSHGDCAVQGNDGRPGSRLGRASLAAMSMSGSDAAGSIA